MEKEQTLSEILEQEGLLEEYQEWERLYEQCQESFTPYDGSDNTDDCPF